VVFGYTLLYVWRLYTAPKIKNKDNEPPMFATFSIFSLSFMNMLKFLPILFHIINRLSINRPPFLSSSSYPYSSCTPSPIHPSPKPYANLRNPQPLNSTLLIDHLPGERITSSPPHFDRFALSALNILHADNLRDTVLLLRGQTAARLGLEFEGVALFFLSSAHLNGRIGVRGMFWDWID
jgi:hypothetical protein